MKMEFLVTKNMTYAFHRVENTVIKRKCYQHFLLFPQCFHKPYSMWPLKVFFVFVFTPYQQYLSYLMATVHKYMFPRLFLNSPLA